MSLQLTTSLQPRLDQIALLIAPPGEKRATDESTFIPADVTVTYLLSPEINKQVLTISTSSTSNPTEATPTTTVFSPPMPIPPAPFKGNVPYRLQHQPIGRTSELQSLANLLQVSTERVLVVAVVPAEDNTFSGIGKTQLAVAFAHHYGQFFPDGVFWIDCAEPSQVGEQIALCGQTLAIPNYEQLDHPTKIQRVLQAFAQPASRLFIFDNCEDEALLRRWLPRGNGSRVLLTSTRRIWDVSLNITTLLLHPLRVEDGLAMFRQLLPHLDEQAIPTLTQLHWQLRGLPLALQLAACQLRARANELTVDGLLQALERGDFLTQLIDVSLSALDSSNEIDALCLKTLRIAAYLTPSGAIPNEVLRSCVLGNDTTQATQAMFAACLQRADALGFLMQEDTGYRLHALLGFAILDQVLLRDELLAAVQTSIENALIRATNAAHQMRMPMQWAHLLSRVAEQAERSKTPAAGLLMARWGDYRLSLSDLAGAYTAYKRAIRIDEDALGLDHPNIRRTLHQLASVCRSLRAYDEACAIYERILYIDELAVGLDHPEVAEDLINLGNCLEALQKFDEARIVLERALEIDEAAFGADSVNVARDLDQLGAVLQEIGDLTAARNAYERALVIDKASFGNADPVIAHDLNHIGIVIHKAGDDTLALSYFERALAIHEAAYGPYHAHVSTCVNNCGVIYAFLGDYTKARAAHERAIEIDEKLCGPNHPSIARDVNNLGFVLHATGQYKDAQLQFSRALKIHKTVYGATHPVMARGINNYGAALFAQGKHAHAQKAFERALMIDQESYGPEHVSVAVDIANLATMLNHHGDQGVVTAGYDRAAMILQKFVGSNHYYARSIEKLRQNVVPA